MKKSSPTIWHLLSKRQIEGEDLVNFCGLLRKHELYQSKNVGQFLIPPSLYLQFFLWTTPGLKKQGKSIFRLSSAVCDQLGARKTSICQNEWELLHMCSCVGPKVMERQSILWPVWKIKGANKFNMGKVTYVCMCTD